MRRGGRTIGRVVVREERNSKLGKWIRWGRFGNGREEEEVNCGGVVSGLLWGRCLETLHERNGFDLSGWAVSASMEFAGS